MSTVSLMQKGDDMVFFSFSPVLVGGTCGIEVAIARGVRVARALRN